MEGVTRPSRGVTVVSPPIYVSTR